MNMGLTIDEIETYEKYYLEDDTNGIYYWLSDSDILAGNFSNIKCIGNDTITNKSCKDE